MDTERRMTLGSRVFGAMVIAGGAALIIGAGGLLPAPAHADSTSTSSTPFVTSDIFDGPPGTVINVSGGNFLPGEMINVFLGTISGTPVATSTARGDSLFGPVAVTIPAGSTPGPLDIAAVGASSTFTASNSFYVDALNPTITATSTADTPGSAIEVTGAGFESNETVTIALGSATTTAHADSNGDFGATQITIPFGIQGNENIVATGQSSGASAMAYFYVGSFYPSVTASSYFAVPGDSITFNGTTFAPNEKVNIFEDAASSSIATATADGTGAFTDAGPVAIPFGLTATSTTFTFIGASSTATTSATIGLGTLNPMITPSAFFLQRGNSFTVSSTGFAANEKIDVMAYGNATEVVTANASGTALAGPFQVPLSASSTLAVSATGESSGAKATASITVGDTVPQQFASSTLTVLFAVDNTAGGTAAPSDFTVSVTGADANPASFAASTTPTTVTIDGDTDFAVTAATSAAGYAITPSGTCSGQIASRLTGTCTLTATFFIAPPSIDIAPTSLGGGTVTDSYSATITASTTASGSFAWSVASGTLPGGLALDTSSTASTTTISGTPTASGSFAFAIGVTSGSSTAQQAYTLNIAAPASSNNGGGGGGGGGGIVVNVGGGGGGGYFFPSVPASTSTTSTSTSTSTATSTATTTGGGQVLGASAESTAVLATQLLSLKGQLVALQFKAMSCSAVFSRNLRRGMSGADVKNLQQALNASGLTQVAVSGPGSPGNETMFFGPATTNAVIAFQDIFSNDILVPNGLSSGNGFVGASTRAKLNALCGGSGQAALL